jgi:glycosyltransferase involved in cell wall biosynthesis
MNILNVSSTDIGGAGIAALRTHNALLENNINSHILFKYQENKNIPNSHIFKSRINPLLKIMEQIKRKLIARKINLLNLEAYTFNTYEYDICKEKCYLQADIIILHWTSTFVGIKSFLNKNNKPVYLYMHDLNHAMGILHYPYELNSTTDKKLKNLENKFFNEKKNIYKRFTPVVICNSTWTQEKAIDSHIFPANTEFHIINYSFNEKEFFPIDKFSAKKALNLDPNCINIGFGSINNNCRRKGYHLLINALKTISTKYEINLITFGSSNTIDYQLNFNIFDFGRINNPNFHRIIYSSMEIFIIPSIEEAFGQTALESLACGTPVIGFNNTGICDIIKDDYNGYLAINSDYNDLAFKIESLINNPNILKKLNQNAILSATKFSHKNQFNALSKALAL